MVLEGFGVMSGKGWRRGQVGPERHHDDDEYAWDTRVTTMMLLWECLDCIGCAAEVLVHSLGAAEVDVLDAALVRFQDILWRLGLGLGSGFPACPRDDELVKSGLDGAGRL